MTYQAGAPDQYIYLFNYDLDNRLVSMDTKRKVTDMPNREVFYSLTTTLGSGKMEILFIEK
jgi:hypothetical protein